MRKKIKSINDNIDIDSVINDVENLHIITTTNEINTYYSFLPSSYQSWKKLFPTSIYILGIITNKDENSAFVKRAKQFCDKLFIYKELPGINSGVQAKTTRMYLTTQFENEICLITDIDYYLLNKNWFLNKIQPVIKENKFVTIGNNGYYNTNENGKWPMYYNIAISNVFKKILNYKNYKYDDWINLYRHISNPIDKKECITNKFQNFSDESLIRYIIKNHPNQEFINKIWVKKHMEGFVKLKSNRRIDRGWWELSCNSTKINSGYYFDCFPLRPFNIHYDKLLPILEYLKINTGKDKLIF